MTWKEVLSSLDRAHSPGQEHKQAGPLRKDAVLIVSRVIVATLAFYSKRRATFCNQSCFSRARWSVMEPGQGVNTESEQDCTQLLHPCCVLTQPDSQEASSAAPGDCRWYSTFSKGRSSAPAVRCPELV